MIDEQPRHIEQARKPGNHENKVQRFYVVVDFHLGTIFDSASKVTPSTLKRELATLLLL